VLVANLLILDLEMAWLDSWGYSRSFGRRRGPPRSPSSSSLHSTARARKKPRTGVPGRLAKPVQMRSFSAQVRASSSGATS